MVGQDVRRPSPLRLPGIPDLTFPLNSPVKPFTKPLNPFGQRFIDLLNNIAERAYKVSEIEEELSRLLEESERENTKPGIRAYITGNTTIEANERWSYDWAARIFSPASGGYVTLTGGLMTGGGLHSSLDTARNRVELISSEDFENADCSGVSGPPGYSLISGCILVRRPVVNGYPVLLELETDDTGAIGLWFDAPNPACAFSQDE